MKTHSNLLNARPHGIVITTSIFLLTTIIAIDSRTHAANDLTIDSKVTLTDLVASVRSGSLPAFDRAANGFQLDRRRAASDLRMIFMASDSSSLKKCAAAYYLGELRDSEAADLLAPRIALVADTSEFLIKRLPVILDFPVAEALAKIGVPSIPAVMRNLEESDDLKVRRLSLKAINEIECDSDIVRLRLQKAIAAQKDTSKKARLNSALQEFLKPEFDK